jgi:hypothetical protein
LHRERGEVWFAAVHEHLAKAEELVMVNAELRLTRFTRASNGSNRTVAERMVSARRARQRALAYAQIHRERGELRRAHFQEEAAAGFALLLRTLEDDLKPEERHQPHSINGQVPAGTRLALDVPVARSA